MTRGKIPMTPSIFAVNKPMADEGEEEEAGCRCQTVAEDEEELQMKLDAKVERLSQLQRESAETKQCLEKYVKSRKALAERWAAVVVARAQVELLRKSHDTSKRTLNREYEELKQLERLNARREERLKRVRSKDLRKREEQVELEYTQSHGKMMREAEQLQMEKRRFLTDALHSVFPIEVQPLSQSDAGEEDYSESSLIDCDSTIEVAEGWLLSGLHKRPIPDIQIVTAAIPCNGDYTLYLKKAKERRKQRMQLPLTANPTHSDPPLPPTSDPYITVPAALVYTAQFVELVAVTLDQPLPYPLRRHVLISEHGNPDRKKRDFVKSVEQLNDNIVYLCFSQHVPLSAITPGHTLENLLALVTHTQLGRSGAFECHPELMQYTDSGPLFHDADTEPPSMSYTADQSLHGSLGNSSSEEEEVDGERFDEDSPVKLPHSHNSGADISKDWESINEFPDLPISSDSRLSRDIHRDMMRHLDYNRTYLDHMALGASQRSSATSVSLSTTDTVMLTESIQQEESVEGGEGEREEVDGGGGVMGALSSIWSSTFNFGRT